jgi:hypothetical protein
MPTTPIQKRIAQLGFAKQTAQGTPATTPAQQIGLASGHVTDVEITEADLDLTWSNRIAEGGERTMVVPQIEFTTVATKEALGFFLVNCLGSDVVTGGAAPYTHTVTPAADTNYLTLWGREDTNYTRLDDAKVSELELSFDRAGALRMRVKAFACSMTPVGVWPTATLDSRLAGGYFTAVGGLGQIDGASAGAVQSGSVKFVNGITPVPSAFQITPAALFPQLATCETSLKIIPNDLGSWQKVLYGAAGGSTISPTPYFGTETVKWILDANTDLQITIPRIQLMTKFPDLAPAGGPAELDVTGKARNPVSGSAWTAVLRNAVAAY